MKALKITLIVLGALVVAVLGGLYYAGFFASIEIKEQQAGGYLLVGTDYTGAYSSVGCPMKSVDSALRANNIKCTKGFGIYYDDPKVTTQEKCRSYLGNILENADSTQLSIIKGLGLKIDSLPIKPSSVIEYNVTSPLSYIIGPMKAYPAFDKHAKEKALVSTIFIEVYDVPNKKVFFIMQHQ